MSNSLWSYRLRHARLPYPSPPPVTCSKSCPLSRWWNPTISSSVVNFSSCLQSFLASGFLSNESALGIRWPKYWSFSISPSNEWKWNESESHSAVSDSLWPPGLDSPWNSLGQNTGVGSLSIPQRIFWTQESNQSLLHCRQIRYQLSYQGSNTQGLFPSNLDGLVGYHCSPRDSQESSPTPQFESISFSVLSILYGPTLTSTHVYWKNHSFDYMDLCWQSNS